MTDAGKDFKEYSALIMSELKRLNDNDVRLQEMISANFEGIRQEIALLKNTKTYVEDLHRWKGQLDVICSPNQLEDLFDSVKSLESFQIKFTTIFWVFQGLLSLGIALLGIYIKLK